MENENNGKQFVITVDGSDDADVRDGKACSGYVLIAFDEPDEAQCIIEHTSIHNIKGVIAGSATLMQAACLAVGERLARTFGRELEMESTIKNALRRFGK